MAQPATLYRFRLDVSDIDRAVYETFDLRVAKHPSETEAYLVTRLLAYALAYEQDIEMTPAGLSDADAPAIRAPGQHGQTKLWIEIGNPSARKLHKASKAAETVKVFTYKDPALLLKDMRSEKVHRAELIPIYSLKPEFLDRVAKTLERDNSWNIVHTDGSLSITINDKVEEGALCLEYFS